MTKTLSAANLTNISATLQDADVLVEMLGISKKWSTKARSGYETRIMGISPLRQTVDPLGGMAARSDFAITIQQETPTQFIQDLEADNEDVDLYLQYGADAQIPLIKGKLDRWELSRGLLILHCIANTQLINKKLPAQQINATEFTTENIPEHNVGKWVPVTFGDHDRAFGLMINGPILQEQQIKFNKDFATVPANGPDGIGNLTDGFVWLDSIKEFVKIFTVLTAQVQGDLKFPLDLRSLQGFVDLTMITIPLDTDGDADFSNKDNAIDEDFGTFSDADTIAPEGDTKTAYLRCRLRQFSFPDDMDVLDDQMYILADIDRFTGGTILATEQCRVGIEIIDGTHPPDNVLNNFLIDFADDQFDNLNENTDSPTALPFDTSQYAAKIGVDRNDDGTKETLPVSILSGRNLSIEYTEAQDTPTVSKILKVMELRLRIDMKAEALVQEYYAELTGYEDDSSGTYTGTARKLIENPADVMRFMLDKLLAVSGIATTSFTTARTDLGNYVIAGQILDLVDATKALDEMARQGKLKLFTDFNDEWAVRAFSIPAGEDASLVRDDGDFVTDDGKEGEIISITQSSLDDLFNQFEILYNWNQATKSFDASLVLDETTSGPIGDWLTESQGRYNLTRKFTLEARWIESFNAALSYGIHLIHQMADRKRIVQWQTSFNQANREIGDLVRLTHFDVMKAEDTTVYSGYATSTVPGVAPFTTIKAGFVDPDTSATIKAGAKVQLFQGRHRYEVYDVETSPLDGLIKFTGRQADIPRSPLSEPF